ncbi:hypothetical protein FRC11_007327 [Ceratobasidium sp. 423]|nr:hypothetical protein FRC11_007327 [Ceratobasidium sp. 423]
MVEELGVTSDPKELGYYSGFVEGIFSVTQFFTIYFWGSLSDRIGRRPVLISGLCGVVGSTIMFGLSKSLIMMLVSRALSGMLNGNSAVIKSIMGEITDETNQGMVFACSLLFWSSGALIAPALGGFLSHPAERYPSVFGFGLFRLYPYLLPCLAGSAFSILGLIAGVLFLEESLPRHQSPDSTSAERRPLLASESRTNHPAYSTSTTRPVANPQLPPPDARESTPDSTEKNVPSVKEIMCIPYTRKVIISYGVVAYVTIAINAVMVLWLYTPVKAGGVGFSVLSVLVFPLGHAFAIAGGKKGACLGVAVMLVVRCIAGMALVSNSLLINRSAPSKHSRGTINGLAQMFASASRAIGPVMATSLFAFSMKSDILGGNLISDDQPRDTESQR